MLASRRMRRVRWIPVGLLAAGAWVIVLGWWVDSAPTVRSVLEASPLSGAIAQTEGGDGQPGIVAVTFTIFLVSCLVGTWYWRRSLLNRWVSNEVPGSLVHIASALGAIALVAGSALVPVVAGIAAGDDLRDADDAGTFTPLFVLLIFVAISAVSWWISQRSMNDAANRPARARPPDRP